MHVRQSLRPAWERLPEDDERRYHVPYPPDFYPGGAYVSLASGETRYWLFGPQDGKRVVFVHGIMAPCPIFRNIVIPMAENGYRVLLYDLYGRGYSVYPEDKHDEALYVNQLHQLMHKVGFKKANIVGHSMGGAIAALLTYHFPEMVEQLIVTSPAGLMNSSDVPLPAKFLRFPGVMKFCTNKMTKPFLDKMIRLRFDRASMPSNCTELTLLDKMREIMSYQIYNCPAFLHGFISSLKNFPFSALQDEYLELGNRGKPILVLWGTADELNPFEHVYRLMNLMPMATVVPLEGGNHDFVITHPHFVLEKITEYFGIPVALKKGSSFETLRPKNSTSNDMNAAR